ncbi:PdxA family dehydrogenase [Acidibrevibacterium fodinaquatile]|uniref:PdxA family dehydrogenase n=1 Tax=Acidibrevibacterium fodinaquatile TaxID=1969806 RepID=UPI000E0D6396|nr:4-hydroxythreonine-4-phosphate dehydrogenase PdxA [Acidibrevibacterium fodinaquatile]
MSPSVVAVAIGDPNGIGPEIAVKAALQLARAAGPRVVLVGDPFVIRASAAREGAGLALREIGDTLPPADTVLDILPVAALSPAAFRPGEMAADAGRATVAYVEAAAAFVRAGHADALVACPHSETAVNAAGIRFSGYPSLLARLAGLPEDRVFLMLVGGGLRIVHATLHERLHDALARLTPELVVATGLAAAAALRRLGIAMPKLGMFGINPHAGEGGLFGRDDDVITAPAAEQLRAAGIAVVGPLGADLLLGQRDCDAFIAMYHDQGHIPVKLLAGRGAAALTIGAGLIFSSVGHGTGFDIAGQGCADPAAVLRAIALVTGTEYLA